ncbi:MAG: hypothetical protein M1837_001787 [Sclerophora amabilis]|nr:MAG: hypothetical protein M1837_001787 [Sclerophora amabilis]
MVDKVDTVDMVVHYSSMQVTLLVSTDQRLPRSREAAEHRRSSGLYENAPYWYSMLIEDWDESTWPGARSIISAGRATRQRPDDDRRGDGVGASRGVVIDLHDVLIEDGTRNMTGTVGKASVTSVGGQWNDDQSTNSMERSSASGPDSQVHIRAALSVLLGLGSDVGVSVLCRPSAASPSQPPSLSIRSEQLHQRLAWSAPS